MRKGLIWLALVCLVAGTAGGCGKKYEEAVASAETTVEEAEITIIQETT